jgi:4-hydroxy-3-methylbut-2-enyl diphosphate reductase
MARQVSSGYSLGPLIHNSSVLDLLKKSGVICLESENSADEISSIPDNSTVILRAHGVPPAVERELVRRGMVIVDATCSRVKVNQGKAGDFAAKGYRVFLAGEKNHAEIKAILGYVQDAACGCGIVVSTPAEAEAAAEELYRRAPEAKTTLKTALIGQTTIRAEEYSAIGDSLSRFFPSIEIVDSICRATVERQRALSRLSGEVDALVIVGSKESANTLRLLSLALELGKPAWLVETASDLPAEIRAYETVGISAGASTPDDLIDEVEEALTQ